MFLPVLSDLPRYSEIPGFSHKNFYLINIGDIRGLEVIKGIKKEIEWYLKSISRD